MELEIMHTCLVKPASPSPQTSLFLSAMDLLMRDMGYNRRVLFYDRPASACGDDEYSLFTATLRRSLSQALAHFYPLAGRLAVDPAAMTADRCGRPRLIVACTDEGVEFIEARIHGVCFTELRSSNFDMQLYFQHLTRWSAYSSKLHEGSTPLLSVQVTRFVCGSIALGIAHSHVLADGYSLWHFMCFWAECAREEPISLYPIHDRTLLKIEKHSREMATIFNFNSVEDNVVNQKDEGGNQRAFSFTKEMVSTLKRSTNNELSTYEVLCAHIWKKVTKAHGHACDVKLSFGSVVNMRGRIKPALPLGYFGNMLDWGIAITSMGELQEEDLTTTALRIREAINSCSDVHVCRLLHCLELYGNDEIMSKLYLNGARMRVSSSPKFPMLNCNFGWGKPLAVRSVVVEEKGKVVFYTGKDGLGSVDVCMALPSQVMQCLESDTSFLMNN